MPTCSRQTLVKDHAFLVKPAYYLKSLYGVRGFCVCDISVVQEICTGEFYQFNLSSCIRQQNSLTAQFVSFSLSNLANIFYPPDFYNN